MGAVAGTAEQTTEQRLHHRPRVRHPLSRLSIGHVVMIVAGLASFLMVFSILRARDEAFPIALAASQLRTGTAVAAQSFRMASVGTNDHSVLGALLGPEEVEKAVAEGWVVTRTIEAGDLVRLSDFRTDAVPSNLRAMSIPIDVGHAVGGALRAGDLVDVIVVREGTAGYVATGIEVLDVASEGGHFPSGFSITVAVDAPTTLRLAAALRQEGLDIVRATGAMEADPLDFYDPEVTVSELVEPEG